MLFKITVGASVNEYTSYTHTTQQGDVLFYNNEIQFNADSSNGQQISLKSMSLQGHQYSSTCWPQLYHRRRSILVDLKLFISFCGLCRTPCVDHLNMILHNQETIINSLRPRQNGGHFADDTFKCIFLKKMSEFRFKFHWSLFLRVQL